MARNIVGIVAGYVALFVATFVTYTLAYLILGVDGSFRLGNYEVSGVWIVVSMVLAFVSAAAGGYVCEMITRNDRAVKILAGVALVIGLVLAYTEASRVRGDLTRPDDVPVLEAMMKSVQPPWVGFVVTLIHVGGILYGGRLVGRGGPEEEV